MNNVIPRVSIGLPVYNGEKYLKTAVESILAQTFTDFELIISDNASTDQTKEISIEFAKSDGRVRYYRSDVNRGAPWNFNNTFNLSKGDYFRWHCVDDIIGSEHLRYSVDTLDKYTDVVLCYPLTIIIDENGGIIGEYTNNLDLRQDKASERYKGLNENLNLCNIQYGLMRRNIVEKTALFGNYIGSDEIFLGELSLHGKCYEIQQKLFFLRMHPESSSSKNTLSDLQHFYNPNRDVKVSFRSWRHLYEKVKMINRTPLKFAEKSSVIQYILRDSISSRKEYVSELINAIKCIFGVRSSNTTVQENTYNPYLKCEDGKSEDK